MKMHAKIEISELYLFFSPHLVSELLKHLRRDKWGKMSESIPDRVGQSITSLLNWNWDRLCGQQSLYFLMWLLWINHNPARGKIIILLVIIKRQLIQHETILDMNPVTTMHNTEIKPSSSFAFLQFNNFMIPCLYEKGICEISSVSWDGRQSWPRKKLEKSQVRFT